MGVVGCVSVRNSKKSSPWISNDIFRIGEVWYWKQLVESWGCTWLPSGDRIFLYRAALHRLYHGSQGRRGGVCVLDVCVKRCLLDTDQHSKSPFLLPRLRCNLINIPDWFIFAGVFGMLHLILLRFDRHCLRTGPPMYWHQWSASLEWRRMFQGDIFCTVTSLLNLLIIFFCVSNRFCRNRPLFFMDKETFTN